jgi:hypothetical protein
LELRHNFPLYGVTYLALAEKLAVLYTCDEKLQTGHGKLAAPINLGPPGLSALAKHSACKSHKRRTREQR